MPDVPMPRLSDSMEEGTIIRWLKADGDEVKRGEEIVEIETDKANMTYEADSAGVLAIVAPEGATVPIGAPIATIGGGSAAAAAAEPAPAAPATVAEPVASVAPDSGEGTASRRFSASPLARRIAAKTGVALEALRGSGPYGRILKADVVGAGSGAGAAGNGAAVAAPAASAPAVVTPAPAAQPAPAATESAGAKGTATVQELSRLQQTVARRMSESKATVPDFTIEMDVDMTAALALRAQLKQSTDTPPSLNDVVIKCVAGALRRHPRVNGSYRDGRFESYERINVGVAVATDDGLVVPTVHDADRRSLGDVAAEVRRLAGRVRSGEITPPELAGGTFTISNLGMFGVDRFAGVVNPPQAAILCVGAVTRRPAVGPDGELVARDQMTLTLVSDHRILYGADAARFLGDVRAALEAPLGVML